jgi:hypothetical protein
MSLDKAIKHKKEKRQEYRGSKRWDSSCRCHGGCGYCESNRTHFDKKARVGANQREQETEYFGYWGMSDPADAIEEVTFERLKEIGVDPWDLEATRELNI